MTLPDESIANDLEAVASIAAVPIILKTIREATGLRFTLIARVLQNRWVACAVHDEINFGLKAGGELEVTTTLCSRVRDTKKPVVIDQATTDVLFRDHQTPKMYGFESYIAVPLYRQDQEYFGTLCGLDPLPNQLNNDKTISMLTLFSQLISLQLEAEDRHTLTQDELDDQRESARLREQFIAVLGHDVRNPLSSIAMGTDLLLAKTEDVTQRRTLERIRSSSRRIEGLVDDVLDLARGRMGGGIAIEQKPVVDLELRLRHVVAEIQTAHPKRVIDFDFVVQGAVRCDERRIEQLLSNLLANAMQHGKPETPVRVSVGGDERTFEMRVTNVGDMIPDDAKSRLFQPYFRGNKTSAATVSGSASTSFPKSQKRTAAKSTSTRRPSARRFRSRCRAPHNICARERRPTKIG